LAQYIQLFSPNTYRQLTAGEAIRDNLDRSYPIHHYQIPARFITHYPLVHNGVLRKPVASP
jgi:hypothetical protein